MRHGICTTQDFDDFAGSGVSSNLPQVAEDGAYPYPLCKGGTFMEIAQRAQANHCEWLYRESAELCHSAGLICSNDALEFQHEYTDVEDGAGYNILQ